MTASPPVDLNFLAELRLELASPNGADESDPILELVDIFIASAQVAWDSLEEAGAGDDVPTMVRVSHQMVSSSSWVGAKQLTAMSQALEVDARAGRGGLQAQVTAIGEELARVLRALRALRDELVELPSDVDRLHPVES